MIFVSGGEYKPLLGQGKPSRVDGFRISETAVTNSQFLKFVKSKPHWQKGKVSKLFADSKYLAHWTSPLKIGNPKILNSPVVNISWFAAKAYCENLGLRLPTVDEWEYLAQFGPEGKDESARTIILEWYSKPTSEILPPVKSTFKNKYGVWDVHGLVWEWVYDFNSAFVTGESRGDSSLEKAMYCGAGSIGAADPSDYAAFMRFGFRSSLKGNYTVANLGFRCAGGDGK